MKEICNRCLWLLAFMVLISFLTACATHRTHNWTNQISGSLSDQDPIYKSYNVQPSDLSLHSKCNKLPSVNIIAIESKKDDYEIYKERFDTGFINPKETMDSVSLYLKNGFEKSHIKIDEKSKKVIQLKLVDVGFPPKSSKWTIRGNIKLELIIPEKKYSKYYEASEDTASLPWVAIVYAIHKASRQIIDDPVIQDYILCK